MMRAFRWMNVLPVFSRKTGTVSIAPPKPMRVPCFGCKACIALRTGAPTQERRSRIDVQKYTIDAEVNPRTQSLSATVKIEFTPLENSSDATFELNNCAELSRRRWMPPELPSPPLATRRTLPCV